MSDIIVPRLFIYSINHFSIYHDDKNWSFAQRTDKVLFKFVECTVTRHLETIFSENKEARRELYSSFVTHTIMRFPSIMNLMMNCKRLKTESGRFQL